MNLTFYLSLILYNVNKSERKRSTLKRETIMCVYEVNRQKCPRKCDPKCLKFFGGAEVSKGW